MTTPDALVRGRASFGARSWGEAYTALLEADRRTPLAADDLVLLAIAAGLTGHDEQTTSGWARAHQLSLERGDAAQAARCAFWLAMRLRHDGEPVRAGGWVARARRILEQAQLDCVEQGYVLLPTALQQLEAGDLEVAAAAFRGAHQIAERFGDPDLLAFTRLGLGAVRTYAGDIADGLTQLDDVMVGIEAGDVSPLAAGIVYCAVIDVCQSVFDLRRAQQWTTALDRWCAAQPDLVPFRGQCQVHRARILQLHGAWPDAMHIAQDICGQDARTAHGVIGPAFAQLAELYRLRGELDRAEEAYRQASRHGHLPEPGLALLRLAQGQLDSAAATIARALDEARDRPSRARLLPAYVEIMLATDDLAAAGTAAQELASIAAELDVPLLGAWAAHTQGAVLLAAGDARAALASLRAACAGWQELEAPYEAARTRELIGLACRALGDEDHTQLELDAAAWTLRQLGAGPDLARVEASALGAEPDVSTGGLTQRELEVLRLLARGKTNRAIAAELVLSEKTVARHVSNIFTKLDLSSRSAATAYAYEHQLL